MVFPITRKMFSSSNSAHPFPPSFFDHERDDIFLHHQEDLLAGVLLPPNASPEVRESNSSTRVSNKAAITKPGSRDRHSKIVTAHGSRDRRVRLSIEIAPKFFHLQEMLGFDKPSKTLDWLLTNSQPAIKELVEMKLSCSGTVAKSLSSTCQCEVVAESTEAADNRDTDTPKNPEKIGLRRQCKAEFHLLSRESRAKARARARERTREKVRIRRPDESKKLADSLSPILPNQSTPIVNDAPRKDKFGIKGKVKPSQILGHERNLINTSKDLSSTTNNYFPHIAQNWNISSTITPANPSTELQNCCKPWEVYNNQTIGD